MKFSIRIMLKIMANPCIWSWRGWSRKCWL